MSVICYNIPSPLLLRQTDLFASDLRYVLPINRRLGPGALLEILRKGELPGSLENDIRFKDHDSQNLNHTLWTAYTCVTYVASFLPLPRSNFDQNTNSITMNSLKCDDYFGVHFMGRHLGCLI